MTQYEDVVESMEASVSMLSCRAAVLCTESESRPQFVNRFRVAVNQLVADMRCLRSRRVPQERYRALRRCYDQVRRIGRLVDDLPSRLELCHHTLRTVREKIVEIMVSLRLVFEAGMSRRWDEIMMTARAKRPRDRALLRPWKTI